METTTAVITTLKELRMCQESVSFHHVTNAKLQCVQRHDARTGANQTCLWDKSRV